MELTVCKIVIAVLIVICTFLLVWIFYLKEKIKKAKQCIVENYQTIDMLREINAADRKAARLQHQSDEEVIRKLTNFAKEKIKDKYKENDRLYKDTEHERDVNEYGETKTPI